jgi:L-iditol 2-dehydrogenase
VRVALPLSRLTVPASLLTLNLRLADNVSYEQASLAEPLSVIIQATRRSRCPEPGSSVLVLGAGAVGLLACAMAKALGATRVVAVDIDEGKLNFAKAEGWADDTLVLPRGPRVSGKESLEAAKALVPLFEEKLGNEGFDSVFECTGVEVSAPRYPSVDTTEPH